MFSKLQTHKKLDKMPLTGAWFNKEDSAAISEVSVAFCSFLRSDMYSTPRGLTSGRAVSSTC